MNFTFETEDDVKTGYTFGDAFDNELYVENLNHFPYVSYRYLQIDGKYGFGQKEMDHRDAVAYFDSMQILANIPIKDFFELDSREWHFHSNTLGKGQNLVSELKSVFGKDFEPRIENTPGFYHFALYQDKGVTASRETGKKSPRIYFFIGDNATIYPMFYDPYHEINPMK